MNDRDCVLFLQEVLPRLRLRWRGFRRVRRQVCRRLQRRLSQLQLTDLAAYRLYLEQQPAELDVLGDCCRITVSRFYRDRAVYRALEQAILPELAMQARRRGRPCLRAWSAGCGSGEEPYSLTILRALSPQPAFRLIDLDVLATDADAGLLQRARTACYPFSAIRQLPPPWRKAAFDRDEDLYCLHPLYRQPVRLVQHDLRNPPPPGPFDLVLCRNLAFTYFDTVLQRETAARIAGVLRDGGLLVLGAHEHLPSGLDGFTPWRPGLPIYLRQAAPG